MHSLLTNKLHITLTCEPVLVLMLTLLVAAAFILGRTVSGVRLLVAQPFSQNSQLLPFQLEEVSQTCSNHGDIMDKIQQKRRYGAKGYRKKTLKERREIYLEDLLSRLVAAFRVETRQMMPSSLTLSVYLVVLLAVILGVDSEVAVATLGAAPQLGEKAISRLTKLIFGVKTGDVSGAALHSQCEGMWVGADSIIFLMDGEEYPKAKRLADGLFEVQGDSSKSFTIATQELSMEALEVVFGDGDYRFLTRAQLKSNEARDAAKLINKLIVGQNYSSQGVIELYQGTGKNVKFRTLPAGSAFRGQTLVDQLLSENPTWDSDIPGCFFVEIDRGLKEAMAEEAMAEISDLALTKSYESYVAAASAAHAASNSPFVFQATDNGFALVHSCLADLYVKFAGSHVNATQYLKVITGMVLSPGSVTVAIVDDIYYSNSKVGKAKAGTDGASLISQEFLTKMQIRRGNAVQFRAISKEVADAVRDVDFSEYCKVFKDVFLNKNISQAEMFLSSTQLPEVELEFEQMKFGKLVPSAHKKSKTGLVQGAKALAEKLGESLTQWAGDSFDKNIVAWYNKMTKWNVAGQDTSEAQGYLFSKGAAMPVLSMDQALSSIMSQEFDARGIDMITPAANFKALGKEFLKGAKKELQADGTVVYIVEMYIGVISIQNGGSMRSTPHVIEAAGSAKSSELTPCSLVEYCEAYDELFSELEEAFGGSVPLDDSKSFEFLGKSRLEPWALSGLADEQAIAEWMEESFSVMGMPDSSHAFANPSALEDALTQLSKQMSDRMVGGIKRQNSWFGMMMMLEALPYGTVSVPANKAKNWHRIGALSKQPIQSAANHRRATLISHEEIQEELVSMGFCIVKGSGKKRKVLGLNLNVAFVSRQQAEDECYADDDGDVITINFISLKGPLLTQLANVLTGPVKVKGVAINAAELSPIEVQGVTPKNKNWRDSIGCDKFAFNYVGGQAIGSFVNMQSLIKALGTSLELPKFLAEFEQRNSVDMKQHTSNALQFFAENEGQNELDDAKKIKVGMVFMIALLCVQELYWIKGEVEPVAELPVGVDLNSPLIWKVEQAMDEETYTELVKEWQEAILVGSWGNEGDFVPFRFGSEGFVTESGAILPFNWFGKLWAKENLRGDTFSNFKAIVSSNEDDGEDTMNPEMDLWMPRPIWEKFHGDAMGYLKAFQSVFLPALTSKHNYVSYYRTGWRFINEKSLAGKMVLLKWNEGKVKKEQWAYHASPLLPACDEHGTFVPYFEPGRAKAERMPGFCNITGRSKILPGWAYLGAKDSLIAIKHERWLMALWEKWEAMSGVPMFKNVSNNGSLEFMTPGNALRATKSLKKGNSGYVAPWAMVTGKATLGLTVEGRSLAPSNEAVHKAHFGLAGARTADHDYKVMIGWFKSFGLDPAETADADGSVYSAEKIEYMLEQLGADNQKRFFGEASDGFWKDHSDDEEGRVIGSLKAALVLNAMAYANLSLEDWTSLFNSLGQSGTRVTSMKKLSQVSLQAVELIQQYAIRTCRYDMINLAALQSPDCDLTAVLQSVDWASYPADQTQTIIIKAKALHEDEMDCSLDECSGCSATLKKELKKLGRGEKSEALKAYTESACSWLNYLVIGFNRPIVMVGFDRLGNNASLGQDLFETDFEALDWFYSEKIRTTSVASSLFRNNANVGVLRQKAKGSAKDSKDLHGSTWVFASNDLKAISDFIGCSPYAEETPKTGKAQYLNVHGRTGIWMAALSNRKVEQCDEGRGYFSYNPLEVPNWGVSEASTVDPEPKGKTVKISPMTNPVIAEPVASPSGEQQAVLEAREASMIAEMFESVATVTNDQFYDAGPSEDELLSHMLGAMEELQPEEVTEPAESYMDEAELNNFLNGVMEANTKTGKVEVTEPVEVFESIPACEGWVLHPEEAIPGSEIYACVGRRAKVKMEEDYFLFPFMVDGKKQLLEVIRVEEENES